MLELLEAGINVITTVNIQHLESIADAVEEVTGAPVQERVPDSVVRRADQIELVDSSPEELRRRMLDGKIYSPQMVPQALEHFFRSENLIALRELAFRFLADEPEEELLEFLTRQQSGAGWEPSERIMVAVTARRYERRCVASRESPPRSGASSMLSMSRGVIAPPAPTLTPSRPCVLWPLKSGRVGSSYEATTLLRRS